MIVGDESDSADTLALALEKKLFYRNFKAYYLGMRNVMSGLDSDISRGDTSRDEHIRRLGELARILTDSGQIFITTVTGVDSYDLDILRRLNEPNDILVVNATAEDFGSHSDVLNITGTDDTDAAVQEIYSVLKEHRIVEYSL